MKHNQSVIRGFIPRIHAHGNIDGFDIKPGIRGFIRGIQLQRSEIPPDFAKTGNAQQNAERSGRRVRMRQ